jgi:RNA polymerase sigma-70 factor (ECF subfamily)
MIEGEMKELIENNLDKIFNYSLFITGDREKALDLMQDTIITVLTKQDLYNEESHFRSWIFRILKNNYLNIIKKEQIRKEINFSDAAPDSKDEPVFLSKDKGKSYISDPILKNRISEVIASLPLEYREVVVFVEIDQLSYEEVAQILDIPVGTVMSRLHRGRSQLRKMLKKEAGELRIVPKKVKNA